MIDDVWYFAGSKGKLDNVGGAKEYLVLICILTSPAYKRSHFAF